MDNPFTLINKDWMLITAGNEQSHNTMTASWGGVGELWGKYVSTIYVRPQRYTLEFVEREDYYSLCFFGPEYRQALNFCGTKSGRTLTRTRRTGLTPCFDDVGPLLRAGQAGVRCAGSSTARTWRRAAFWIGRPSSRTIPRRTCTGCSSGDCEGTGTGVRPFRGAQ